MKIFDLFDLNETIQVGDVSAPTIAETPVYKILLDKKNSSSQCF